MIWSATPYCGEADVLEIRLATLDPVVDRHVIVEATATQRGKPKPLLFWEHRERFAAWEHKITYLSCSLPPGDGTQADWNRERSQRDFAVNVLFNAADDDLVLLSDVDEIPEPEHVRDYGEPHRLEMDMHMYFLNWRWPERPVRYGTRATVCRGELVKQYLPSRIVEASWPVTGRSGWHLAYQMTAAQIRDKILNIADDLRRPEHLDLDWIETCRQSGADVFRRDFRQCEWCPDSELPPYVQENRERFEHLLIPEPVGVAA